MNLLSIPRIQTSLQDMDAVTGVMVNMPSHPLDCVPWPQYPYKPGVRFSIAHNGHFILLRFQVRENTVRAAVWETNGPVWEDSCVEFFVGFDETGYYNLECNATGTFHAAFGKKREQRNHLEKELIGKIRRQAMIHSDNNATEWTMVILVPVSIFLHHGLQSFAGIKARGNFYKCGDLMPQPHYLAWNNIQAPEPDFHLPQYFGTLEFEP